MTTRTKARTATRMKKRTKVAAKRMTAAVQKAPPLRGHAGAKDNTLSVERRRFSIVGTTLYDHADAATLKAVNSRLMGDAVKFLGPFKMTPAEFKQYVEQAKSRLTPERMKEYKKGAFR